MENKKKGLFTGFSAVFSFTAEQNMKGKGFKISGIAISILCFAIGLLIPVLMAAIQMPDDEDKDNTYGIEENFGDEENLMDSIVVTGDALPQGFLEGFLALCGYEDMPVEYTDIEVSEKADEFSEYALKQHKHPLGLAVKEEKEQMTFVFYNFEEAEVSEDVADGFAMSFQAYYDDQKYTIGELPEETIEILTLPAWIQVEAAGETEKEMGVVIAQMVVPAIFSLILFMMTVLYGQSITKVIMAEKSSKLMEVLLISVKPYALIAGKIIAMAVIAIVQMASWLVLGIIGFLVGCRVGEHIYPDYVNYVTQIIDLIQQSGTGFSIMSVIIAVLMTIVGFLMYCVWAGFIASVVEKVDDISTAMSLYQIPVMIGFMISYLGSLMEMDALIKFAEYLPITSPFVMPADILIGKASVAGGLVSLVLLAAFTLGMVLLTGKVYKNKIFNKK